MVFTFTFTSTSTSTFTLFILFFNLQFLNLNYYPIEKLSPFLSKSLHKINFFKASKITEILPPY
jgi:hypothetical protein